VTEPQWRYGVIVTERMLPGEYPRLYLDRHFSRSRVDLTGPASLIFRTWVVADYARARHLRLSRPQRPFKEVGRA